MELDAKEGRGRRVAGICVLQEANGGEGTLEAGGVEGLGTSEGDVEGEGGDVWEGAQGVQEVGEFVDPSAGEYDDGGVVHGGGWEGR